MDRGTDSINNLLNAILFSIVPSLVDILIAVAYFVAYFNIYFGLIVFVTMAIYLGKIIALGWINGLHFYDFQHHNLVFKLNPFCQ